MVEYRVQSKPIKWRNATWKREINMGDECGGREQSCLEEGAGRSSL